LISTSPDTLLPRDADLERLADTPYSALQTEARNGEPFAYAATHLVENLRLIVGYPAEAALASARGLLQQRIAELSFFLLVCLGAVMFGLDRSVVLPIRRIADAVQSWRSSGSFTPGDLSTVPTEMRQLAETFADATATLNDREQQLRAALAHRDMLLREVNHRVKNNLQVVASLLNLQASGLRSPEVRHAFSVARDRVRALSTLHRHLYMHDEGTRIEVKAFLTELAETLFASLGENPGERISLEIEAPTLHLQSHQAVPLALLTTEALTNALKYAFPSRRHGTVWLELDVAGTEAKLSVCDNGVGMDNARVDPDATGLGTQLIRAFAQQIGGTLDIGPRPGGGTVLTVRFTVAPPTAPPPGA
jgi:two-component sensor histidine kinase